MRPAVFLDRDGTLIEDVGYLAAIARVAFYPWTIDAIRALNRAGLTIDQIGLVELNEAFAAQAIACIRELKLDPDKVNIYGGGIALGHPLGCTGAKLLTTLVHALQRRNTQFGLVTMCIGVGQGIAMIVERV